MAAADKVKAWVEKARAQLVPALHRGELPPVVGARVEFDSRYFRVVYIVSSREWASDAEQELFESVPPKLRGTVLKDISALNAKPGHDFLLRELQPESTAQYRCPPTSRISWPGKPAAPKVEPAPKVDSPAVINGEHLRKPPAGGFVVHCPVCWKAGHYTHASSRHNTLESAKKARDAHVCREK